MVKIFNALLLAAFVGVITIVSYWLGQQAYSWMPTQGTAEAKLVDNLFSFLVAVGSFVFLGISGFISYSILTCRAAKDDFTDARPDRGNPKLEVLWTGIPILLVLWIAAQNYRIYQQIDIQGLTPIVHLHPVMAPAYAETSPSDSKPTASNNNAKPVAEEIDVVARQWGWTFGYPGRNITSTELHLPVNQSVSLSLRSLDVLHGFYIPEFRVKQDIIPNRTIKFVVTPLSEGKYRLQDSQFSGTYFALMTADVYIDSPQAYATWVNQAGKAMPTTANNLALAEHNQKLTQKAFRSRWPTVAPAPPPKVNHP